ncbi:NAD-dependent protein deacylase [Thalassovita gelatinovora]|uniref:NAD-dependent protein deacylase n=1 Tax=Thalassovita gelatinovora TaxID=53501 RepID=A0A0P1FCV1_THAGE|nr:NAD-dependent deacylase [Thalassovita gelatinovora]QIZ80553.1 NAD-dependent deacylase [Thalassovita gelatinovora]CUH66041.1 NAD-dependent protein deacylase [Thalassovita gelatinovora]SEQ75990.1 NAD-dependent deacetylase [Thalassovita gelatinovora]
MEKIVILTGAGISAESGLGTFRDEGGLWAQHRIEDVATPEGFARNPQLVHDFYNARRLQATRSLPNSAHTALALLEAEHPAQVIIITQNVDGLHEAAGSRTVLHMHGRLAGALCAKCGHRWAAPDAMRPDDPCPACSTPATRPDIVWFGEIPYHMGEIWDHLRDADLFAAIGTSGEVYPAAAFVQDADRHGAHTVELNLEPSSVVSDFSETHFGKATETVPLWVKNLLNG